MNHTFNPLKLHPYCNKCGWRKGGRDSWDGIACKCGESAQPITTADKDDPNIYSPGNIGLTYGQTGGES